MKKNQHSDPKDISGTTLSGASELINELQGTLAIYAKDLKKLREGKSDFELLGNEEIFNFIIKILTVVDKIKKLDTPDTEPKKNTAETNIIADEVIIAPSALTIQDFALKKA